MTRARLLMGCLAAALALPPYTAIFAAEAAQPGSSRTAAGWGTYWKPFAVDSLWNSRPVGPVLGDFVIPKSQYFPLVAEGKYSLGVFLAREGDRPVTVTGLPGRKGVWDPDAEAHRESVTIARWPAAVVPAEGSDGHADIVDPVSGLIHSFNTLRFQNGRWVASQYAWSRLDGRGWGTPAHYFQGARAAAVPSMAGLIRRHEVDDGEPVYRHALAVSLTYNALSAKPAYVFPATSADGDATKTNSGAIPEGALIMLPQSFDTRRILSPALRKVAETLKVYGAYVVDRNVGTPFYIYVENGSGFNLHGGGWNAAVAADLDRIRQALRQVTSAEGWVDGEGRAHTPEKNLNLLSMRGPWRLESGSAAGVYDTWAQAVVFPDTAERIVQVNASERGMNPVSWALPAAGASYRLTAIGSGGAKLRFQLRDRAAGKVLYDSGEIGNGETTGFAWPREPVTAVVYALSGIGRPSTIGGTLVGAGRPERTAGRAP